METALDLQPLSRPCWVKTIVSLLPVWLISLSITVEGFPPPPITLPAATAAFVVALLLMVILVWKKWMRIEQALYSLFPLALIAVFDEIVTPYKTSFIFMCAILFSAGLIASRYARNTGERVVILGAALVLTLLIATRATANFWEVLSATGSSDGYMTGRYPVEIPGYPWWKIFWGW